MFESVHPCTGHMRLWRIHQFHQILRGCHSHYLRGHIWPTVPPPPPKLCKMVLMHVWHYRFNHRHDKKRFDDIQNPYDQVVLTIPNSTLYIYPELRNRHLKMWKWFARSFPAPETGRNLSDNFLVASNCASLAQDRGGELNLVVRTGHRDSEYVIKTFLLCLWMKWRSKMSLSFMKSQCDK